MKSAFFIFVMDTKCRLVFLPAVTYAIYWINKRFERFNILV